MILSKDCGISIDEEVIMDKQKLNDILLGTKFDKQKMDALTLDELIEIYETALYSMIRNKGQERREKFFQSRSQVFYMLILERMMKVDQIFVLFSNVSKLPYVVCDEKTFDDQIYIFMEEDKAIAKKESSKFQSVVKLEKNQLKNFYLSLYPLGINALVVNAGKKTVRIQLKEFCKEPDYSKIPEEKRPVTNPELQLTSIYYVQQLREQAESEEKKDLTEMLEEIHANLKSGKFFLIYRNVENEDGTPSKEKIEFPSVQLKNGEIFHPIFTDLNEVLKFPNVKTFHPMILDLKSIFKLLAPEVRGVILNPQSVQIMVTREVVNKEK